MSAAWPVAGGGLRMGSGEPASPPHRGHGSRGHVWIMRLVRLAVVEHLIDFWREAGGFIAGNQKLFVEIVWPHFWAIQILLVVLILMYCSMHELVRVLGRAKVLEMFFGTPPATRG